MLSHAKDDAALNLQNVVAAAPSRFNEVGLYAPSQSQGLSPMNQQTVAYLASKTAASSALKNSLSPLLSFSSHRISSIILSFKKNQPPSFFYRALCLLPKSAQYLLKNLSVSSSKNHPHSSMIYIPFSHPESTFPKNSVVPFHEHPLHTFPLTPPTWKNNNKKKFQKRKQ